MCLLVSYSFGQSTSIPRGISILGEPYIENFLSLKVNLQEIERDLYSKKGQFADVSALVDYSCNKYSELTGSTCDVDKAPIIEVLSQMEPGGANYTSLVSNLNVSETLKELLNGIISDAIAIQNDTDFDSFLERYSSSINSYELNEQERELLKQFIVGYYANYEVIINSNTLRDAVVAAEQTASIPNISFYSNSELSFEGGLSNVQITEQTVNDLTFRRWWEVVLKAAQCALGTSGGALVGGVGGAAVGTVVLPIVGTVSGAAVGFWGGAMAGAAASCF